MAFITLPGLRIKVPTKGTTGWDQVVLSDMFAPIAAHRHTGDPDGNLIPTAGIADNSITGAKIRLNNDEFLRARNFLGTGDINILKVNTDDKIELGPLLALKLVETGAGTDDITIQSPVALAAPYTLTMPIDDGNSGEALTTDGAGVLSWLPTTGANQDINTIVDTDFTFLDGDGFRHVHATAPTVDRTVFLPATPANNTDREFITKKVDAGPGAIILDGNGALIDGQPTKRLTGLGSSAYVVCDGTNYFTVALLGTVSAEYLLGSNQAIPDSVLTVVDYATQLEDTHNAVVTGAGWTFTAPEDGLYSLSSGVRWIASSSWTVGNETLLRASRNGNNTVITGARFIATKTRDATNTDRNFSNGTSFLRLAQGDTVQIKMIQNSGGARTLEAAGEQNTILIEKVANL